MFLTSLSLSQLSQGYSASRATRDVYSGLSAETFFFSDHAIFKTAFLDKVSVILAKDTCLLIRRLVRTQWRTKKNIELKKKQDPFARDSNPVLTIVNHVLFQLSYSECNTNVRWERTIDARASVGRYKRFTRSCQNDSSVIFHNFDINWTT